MSARPSQSGKPGKTRPKSRRPFGIGFVLILALKVFIFIHAAYIGLTSSLIFLYKFVDPPFTILMPYRSLGYGWKLTKPIPIPLSKVPLYIRSMLVAVEDGKFYTHRGIDMEAFKRAREVNAKLGKPLYGGSTLTMQVARTLFLVPEKSYIRKYFEVIAALELELILSKDRILELYFSYAEWGKGIFGIEAASRYHYKKGVSSLTREQAARLIALLSSPIKYTPSTLHKSAILRERYAYLTRRFVSQGSLSPDNTKKEDPPLGSIEPGAIEQSLIEPVLIDPILIDPSLLEPSSVESTAIPAEPTSEAAPQAASDIKAIDPSLDQASETLPQSNQNPVE